MNGLIELAKGQRFMRRLARDTHPITGREALAILFD
jgi:hypothetical protein